MNVNYNTSQRSTVVCTKSRSCAIIIKWVQVLFESVYSQIRNFQKNLLKDKLFFFNVKYSFKLYSKDIFKHHARRALLVIGPI